jgi:hypothetical protein
MRTRYSTYREGWTQGESALMEASGAILLPMHPPRLGRHSSTSHGHGRRMHEMVGWTGEVFGLGGGLRGWCNPLSLLLAITLST